MNESFTPQVFINELNRINTFNDNRVFIWYCNLYIEHFVKLIFKEHKKDSNFGRCDKCNKSSEPSFMAKVQEIIESEIIDPEIGYDVLIKAIYEARNSAGHELNFNEVKVIENIIKGSSKVKSEDPYGLIEQMFGNISPWENLKLSAVAVVTALYEGYEKKNGRVLLNKLIFEIDPVKWTMLPLIIDKTDERFC